MRRPAALLLLGAALLGAAACDDAFVDPFLRDAAPYSLYGLVIADVTPRIQRVRVQRVRALADLPTTSDVDGRVESADPGTGALVRWTPREVEYWDGSVGTVFEREFQPAPETSMDLAYEDRDGRRLEAAVRFPPRPTATIEAPADGEDGGVHQRITWDAARIADVAVVDYYSRDSDRVIHSIRVEYRPEADGRSVVVHVLRDLQRLYQEVGETTFTGELPGLEVRMTVLALTDDLPPSDVVPTEDLGRVYVQGATAGRVLWSPRVVVDP